MSKNDQKKSNIAPEGAMSMRPRAHQTINTEPTMTEQHHLEDVKIGSIMARYEKTGLINHVAKHRGQYMNMINAPDFVEAQQRIAEANSMFETIPAKIRAQFENDPAKFLNFIQNPQNKDKIEELGFDSSHLPVASDVEQASSMEAPHTPSQTPSGDAHKQNSLNLSPSEQKIIEAHRAAQEPSE